MIFDWDDLTDQDTWFIDKLKELRAINPLFKCTVFAIPGKCDDKFLATIPDWIQLGGHGWVHDTNYESAKWHYDETRALLVLLEGIGYWQKIFKFPGWQGSKEARIAIRDEGWILADNPNYIHLRIPGLKVYDWTEWGEQAYHGHVHSWVGGNGILQQWDLIVEKVKATTEFKFISEVVK